jgi:formylglycine-generating enzyme required for sulfatase activity
VVTLAAKPGYIFENVAENSFTYTGATATNPADSTVVAIVFPATGPADVVTAKNLDSLITAPVVGAAPNKAAINTTQYTGTIAWKTADGTAFEDAAFAPATVYQAVITLTAKIGYTFDGVAVDSFTYTGATSVSNIEDSGAVTIVFPATAATVDALDLSDLVTAPVKGAPPGTTAIDEAQYTGTIAWQTAGGAAFAGGTAYQAVVTLAAKSGFTFAGLTADSFTYTGATTVTNAANSGTVTILFPATDIFSTPAQYRTMVQVNSANITITGSGTLGVFKTDRTVTLTPYKIAKFETTWQLWKEVYDWAVSDDRGAGKYTFANPGVEGHGENGTGTNANVEERITRSVSFVNWRDAIIWCNAYSELSGLTPVYYTDSGYGTALRISTNESGGSTAADSAVAKPDANGYRLPTEAQWEAAARGGNPVDTTNWGYTYAGSNTIDDVAWYIGNAGNIPEPDFGADKGVHPVGKKTANSLGLCDMSGNVREWVWDRRASNVGTGDITDPTGPNTGALRVTRGGSYQDAESSAAVFERSPSQPVQAAYQVGFRVARIGTAE